ncbi:MAG: T9SS type A sorting domain-containing protein [Bacteroidota bacterium]
MKKILFLLLACLCFNFANAQFVDFATVPSQPFTRLELYNNTIFAQSFISGQSTSIYKKDINSTDLNMTLVVEESPPYQNIMIGIYSNNLYYERSLSNGSSIIERKIFKLDLSISSATPVEFLDLSNIGGGGWAINPNDNYMYGIRSDPNNFGRRMISKIDLSSTNPTVIDVISNLESSSIGVHLAFHGDYAYGLYTRYSDRYVFRVNITTNNPSYEEVFPITTGYAGIISWTVSGNMMYYPELNDLFVTDYIRRVDLTDPNFPVQDVMPIPSGFALGIVVADDYLYLPTGNGIVKTNISALNLSVNEFNAKETSLYPNPTSSYLQINNLKRTASYKIYNMLGVQVSKGSLAPNEQIEVSTLESGMYFIQLNNTSPIKFIKK